MKKIRVRKVDWKIFIVNLILVVVPLYFIVSNAYEIQHTVVQTGFVICWLSILGGINFLIVKSGTCLIDIITLVIYAETTPTPSTKQYRR